MKYIATYTSPSLAPYYRTIFADRLNEALKDAEKFTRKGFVLLSVMSKE